MTFFESDISDCPVELSLRVINRKWVIQIIRDMFFGKKRFSEFKDGKPDLSNKALSRCLKFMEDEGLISKNFDEENNFSYYLLTDKGRSLNRLIYDLVNLLWIMMMIQPILVKKQRFMQRKFLEKNWDWIEIE